ncbi:MAG: hypothetical protein MZV65_13715 [Chromatiales bacterium]|nr:hypothetical protein [Chromatiales bacterium]
MEGRAGQQSPGLGRAGCRDDAGARTSSCVEVEGRLLLGDAFVTGYEIHAGISTGPGAGRIPPFSLNDGRPDGALSDDGQLLGTYLHGLFDAAPARDALLRWAGTGGAGNAGLPAVARRRHQPAGGCHRRAPGFAPAGNLTSSSVNTPDRGLRYHLSDWWLE